MISDVLGIKMGKNYESIAKLWLCNKRYGVTNIVTSALCWSVWKLRNILCFQGAPWTGMRTLWQRMVSLLRCWNVLVPLKLMLEFKNACSALKKKDGMVSGVDVMPDRTTVVDMPGSGVIQFQPP